MKSRKKGPGNFFQVFERDRDGGHMTGIIQLVVLDEE